MAMRTMIFPLLMIFFLTAAAVAPSGPDNLTTQEAVAVQERLDQFFTLFAADGTSCRNWAQDAFIPEEAQFNHPPPLGVIRGYSGLQQFCETVRNISKVQEMRQDGPFKFVATAENHTRLDVVLPALYLNDAPFAKTMDMVLRLTKSKEGCVYKIQEASEVLTSTQSTFTFPPN